MWVGALAIGGIILGSLHLIFWQVRGIYWLPNMVGTIIACALITAGSVGLVIAGSVHLMLIALVLFGIGIPTFLLINKFPVTRRERY